jgi:hypothetical protein
MILINKIFNMSERLNKVFKRRWFVNDNVPTPRKKIFFQGFGAEGMAGGLIPSGALGGLMVLPTAVSVLRS